MKKIIETYKFFHAFNKFFVKKFAYIKNFVVPLHRNLGQ